jgi:hypothetical protein
VVAAAFISFSVTILNWNVYVIRNGFAPNNARMAISAFSADNYRDEPLTLIFMKLE